MILARHLTKWPPLLRNSIHPARRRWSRGLFSTKIADTGGGSKRIRVISCDVTGTLVSFLGKIEDHYGTAARVCGVELHPDEISQIGPCFNRAYQETCQNHPCFGGSELGAKDWWRRCVNRSFELVDVHMTAAEQERVFQRIYSKFGSHAAYDAFPDAIPFLKWCQRRGIVTGVISNADERYGDSILPMLGLGDDMRFLTFSKNIGHEKPEKEIFESAMKQAEPWLCLVRDGGESPASCPPLKPEEVLHIGNDFNKDYVGAREAGFHAALLDRFDEKELARSWKEKGAPVFKDLIDVVGYLGHEQFHFGPPTVGPSQTRMQMHKKFVG